MNVWVTLDRGHWADTPTLLGSATAGLRCVLRRFLELTLCNCRDTMARLPGMISAIEEIKQRGFELNFPTDACHNMCRVCYWRRSMRDCVNSDVRDLSRMFKEVIRVLFESQFYKLARDAAY